MPVDRTRGGTTDSGWLDAYRRIVGEASIDELRALAKPLTGKRVQHINATRVGGGVAEILHRLIPLSNELGLVASWDVIEGADEFYQVTKAFHNAIQGNAVDIGAREYEIFTAWNRRNAAKIDLHGDYVMIHDPQPCAMPSFVDRRRRSPGQRFLWRCHIDASHPHRQLWTFLEQYIRRYDSSIFSAPLFTHSLPIPQFIVAPSIDPFSDKNRPLEPDVIVSILERYGIDPRRPILTQVSRFDRFKDPLGVLRAYRMVRATNDCQLVIVGGGASDDPEGAEVLAEVREEAGNDPDVHVLDLPPDSHVEINALQRGSTVVFQKSLREGFGLTVSEALWKGKPVIGGATGGIPLQILEGLTGYLVYSAEGAAFRARYLLNHPEVAHEMGRRAVEQVRQNFLLTRHLRDYLLALLATNTTETTLRL